MTNFPIFNPFQNTTILLKSPLSKIYIQFHFFPQKFYSTKFAPPKKESKEQKRLSDNIKRFLEKREIEEREKRQEEREKRDKLLAMRDDKSKNKIKKMLKVIKSANKSVLEDAKSTQTAVTADGNLQPDEDDYGYVSREADALFQKYCEKVKDVKDDKGFSKSRPQSRDDMKGTKERVRQALIKEQEEKLHPAPRTRVSNVSTTPHREKHSEHSVRRGGRDLYDPAAEKEAEEKKRKEEEMKKKANMKKKLPPPPMNFNDLLKLAEKKQFEPVAGEIIEVKPKTREPERLLTAKEKKELEEREARKNNKLKTPAPVKPLVVKEKEDFKKVPISKQKTPVPTREFPPKINGASSNGPASTSSSLQSQKKPTKEVVPQKSRELPPKDPQKTRPFPPKDTVQKTREFPPKDIYQKTREFPPTDVRRPKPSASSSYDNRKPNKRELYF